MRTGISDRVRGILLPTLLATPFFLGCDVHHKNGVIVDPNRPKVTQISPQTVQEGTKIEFTFDKYISDPNKRTLSVEKISGPGDIWNSNLNTFTFRYTDKFDPDIDHQAYTVAFRVKNDQGKFTDSSFTLTQKDIWPEVIPTSKKTLSSGLESTVLDTFMNCCEGFRRPQVSLAVNSKQEALILFPNDSFDFVSAFPYANVWIRRYANPEGGEYSSAVFDRNDVAHVSFDGSAYPGGGGEVLYKGTFQSAFPGAWIRERLDENASVGLENDLALDQNDKVHISYISWAAKRAKYATNVSGGWKVEDLANCAWNQTSIATDLANKAHLVHVTPNNMVQYLTNASGWQPTIIAGGTNPVIRRDNQGAMHVVFRGAAQSLYHATQQGANWILEPLPSSRILSPEHRLSFEIDQNNKLMICYIPSNKDSLYLVTNHGGAWKEHRLDNGGPWINPRIALDRLNNVHIAGARQGKVTYLRFLPTQLPQ